MCGENNNHDPNDDVGPPLDTLQPDVSPRRRSWRVGLFGVYLLSSLGKTHCRRSWGKHCTGVCVCVGWVCVCARPRPRAHLPSPPLLQPSLTSPSRRRKNVVSFSGSNQEVIEGSGLRPRPLLEVADLLTTQLFWRCKGECGGGGKSSMASKKKKRKEKQHSRTD